MNYRAEADALDREILGAIAERHVPDFNDLALRIFAHQLRYNKPYSKYCASLGVTLEAMPDSWERIAPVPAAAFKEAALCTFEPERAALTFETSGTTTGTGGKHYMETAALYDAALLAGFRDAVLADVHRPLRYLLFVPNPKENLRSSLGYMMKRIAETYGDRNERWYLSSNTLEVDRLVADVRALRTANVPACIAATAFALVDLLDAMRERTIDRLELPVGSRIMETGGFKGRTREVDRNELYTALGRTFAVPVISEYGMTELSSQYYDRPVVLRQAQDDRLKRAPPWMRSYAVGINGEKLPRGTIGALVHVDLANRSSCVAVQTEDLGAEVDGGIVLIGREHAAELRGCSLDAEALSVARL